MRIVHTIASIDNWNSGPTYSVLGLSKAQEELGIKSSILSLSEEQYCSPGSSKHTRFSNSLSWIPLFRRLGASSSMRRALNKDAPEIIHTHGLWRLVNIYKPPSSAFVIAPRGMLSSEALSYSRRQKALFQLLFQNRALSAATLFHATAESEYNQIRRFGLRQPVAIIPNGIDLPKKRMPIRALAYARSVLFLGRIHPIKGLDSLIRAWVKIERDFPDCRLRIVGPDEGGYAAELQKLIQSLALRNVSIEEAVYSTAKTEMMAKADLFILPSRSENFAMTVAESLALGVPVISTKSAPWSGLETHKCGWWVDQGSEPLAMALRSAMSKSSEELHTMGLRGQAWMERDYSWRRVATMTLETYNWLLGRGNKPEFVWYD